jgi:hypothetical protein
MVRSTDPATKGRKMTERDESTREAARRALESGEQPYERPALTVLGSFTELTKQVKSGPVTDPGDTFQPSAQ